MKTERQLADEAARWRRSYREAQAVIDEQNRTLLGLYLRDRLADPRDFELLVGLEAMLDLSGRLVWDRVEAATQLLLEQKPHLAATPHGPFPPGAPAVDFFATET